MYLILIHEVGHSLLIKILGYKLNRIELYPCGGCSKFESLVNISLRDELIILIAGPLFQIGGFLIAKSFINYKYYLILKKYHYLILGFNLLPIYPLDGGRLTHIVLAFFLPFKKSFKYLFYISYISFWIVVFLFLKYVKIAIFAIVLVFLYISLLGEVLKFSSYYYKFLLERYLYDFRHLPLKIVNSISRLKKNRYHMVRKNDKLIPEKEYLTKVFIDLNEERRVL